jgi:hypothetical protein
MNDRKSVVLVNGALLAGKPPYSEVYDVEILLRIDGRMVLPYVPKSGSSSELYW